MEVVEGSLWWQSDGKKIPASSGQYLFIPPYSWAMEHYMAGTRVKIKGLISRTRLSTSGNSEPIIFNSDKSFPVSTKHVEKLLSEIANPRSVAVCSNPSALSARIKALIDAEYASSIEVGNIAKKLKTSSAFISRSFKKDFGKPPTFYRKGLKVTVGMYELMMGVPPIKAAEMAGYKDLGRFYKQFKSYLTQTPSEYLEKSKNAKNKKATKSK
jgi:YesN/AraC family two-component response regulator